MSKANRSFLFIAITVALASSLSLLGGLGLEYISDKILPLVPLIIAIPSMNDLIGDYASIIAAHMGDPSERKRSKIELLKSIAKVLCINISAIIVLSLLTAHARGYLITVGFVIRFIPFVIGAIIVAVSFMFVLSHTMDLILRKRHINPDELLIPIVTSIADVIMLLIVTLAVITIF